MNDPGEAEQVQRRRLMPEQRRAQLIDIGLDQLITRPEEPLSVEQVAAKAQISRGLLFRYFATKQEFFVAVAEAMVQRIEDRLVVDDHGTADHRMRQLAGSYLEILDDHPDWAAPVSTADFGSSSGVGDVIGRLRGRLVERTIDILGCPDDEPNRSRLAGWWALLHTVGRSADTSSDACLDYGLTVLPAVLDPELVTAPGSSH